MKFGPKVELMTKLLLFSALISLNAFADDAKTCTVTAQTEYFDSGKDLQTGAPYSVLNDKRLEQTCMDVLKGFISTVAEKAEIDAKKAAQATQLNLGKAFELVENGYVQYTGCKPHDCGVKTLTIMDSKGANGVLVFLEGKKLKIASNLSPIPAAISARIDAWKEAVQTKQRKYFPGWTLKEQNDKP